MAIEIKYKANTAMCTINTANSNLNGSGTLGTLLTASEKGTIIKTIIIKAQTDTSDGIIRLFIYNNDLEKSFLIMEVPVNAVTKSSRDCSFSRVIPWNYEMQNGDILKVSTQNAETFNIIAEGLDYYYPDSYTEDSIEYESFTGLASIFTANSNLDGSGTIVNVLTSHNSPILGCEISSIKIKATQNTTPGMVRLFIKDSEISFLFAEVLIPYSKYSSSTPSFSYEVIRIGSFYIQAGFSILASTQNAETFNVIIESSEWSYLN